MSTMTDDKNSSEEDDRKMVAWGITGSGDKLVETIDVMKEIKKKYADRVGVKVYLSKAGDQVLRYYRLRKEIDENFVAMVEVNSNTPFLAGQLQLGKFEFLLIAPATSNTVAKIASSIADSLLTNAAILSLKGLTPVYIMPTDMREGKTITKLPNGKELEISVRKEDAENVKKLANMKGIYIIERPADILRIFETHFN
jgi:archaeoflavoprotein AfpA